MNNQENASRTSPLEDIMSAFPVQKGISDFYYSLTNKLREIKGVDKSVPIYSAGFCADMIFEHIVKYEQWWETFSASEIYELGNMNIGIDYVWKGNPNKKGMIYRPSTYAVIDQCNNLFRKGGGKYFFEDAFEYDPGNPPKLMEDESLLITIFHPKDNFDEFVKNKLKNGY